MMLPIEEFLNQQVWVAFPTGAPNSSGERTYTAPKKVWCLYGAAAWRLTRFHGDQVNDESELITIVEIPQYTKVWIPGADHTKEAESTLVEHTHPVYGFDHKPQYYVTKL